MLLKSWEDAWELIGHIARKFLRVSCDLDSTDAWSYFQDLLSPSTHTLPFLCWHPCCSSSTLPPQAFALSFLLSRMLPSRQQHGSVSSFRVPAPMPSFIEEDFPTPFTKRASLGTDLQSFIPVIFWCTTHHIIYLFIKNISSMRLAAKTVADNWLFNKYFEWTLIK